MYVDESLNLIVMRNELLIFFSSLYYNDIKYIFIVNWNYEKIN